MEHKHIAAFIKSTQSIFETMLQMPVTIGEPSAHTGAPVAFDVSAVIGMTGDVSGTVVLSFPRATAERLVAIFTGTDVSDSDDELSDAVGELVNIIGGGAKAQFTGQKVGLGIPSVVIGAGHAVFNQKQTVIVTIPCECDCGEFNLEIALKETPPPPSSHETSTTSIARGAC